MDQGHDYKMFVVFALENKEGSLSRGLKAFEVNHTNSEFCT